MGQLGFIPALIAVAAPFIAKGAKKLGKKLKKKKKAPAPAAAPPPPPVSRPPAMLNPAGRSNLGPGPMSGGEQQIMGVPLRYLVVGGALVLSLVVVMRSRR